MVNDSSSKPSQVTNDKDVNDEENEKEYGNEKETNLKNSYRTDSTTSQVTNEKDVVDKEDKEQQDQFLLTFFFIDEIIFDT